jgi:hypothetical protein
MTKYRKFKSSGRMGGLGAALLILQNFKLFPICGTFDMKL